MSDFKRVMFEDWSLWIPMVSFGIFFMVFILVSVRAIRTNKTETDRMASLPLEEPSPESFKPRQS
jgi:hypothetical protein